MKNLILNLIIVSLCFASVALPITCFAGQGMGPGPGIYYVAVPPGFFSFATGNVYTDGSSGHDGNSQGWAWENGNMRNNDGGWTNTPALGGVSAYMALGGSDEGPNSNAGYIQQALPVTNGTLSFSYFDNNGLTGMGPANMPTITCDSGGTVTLVTPVGGQTTNTGTWLTATYAVVGVTPGTQYITIPSDFGNTDGIAIRNLQVPTP